MPLRLPPVLQRPLQVCLQPLQGSAQVLLRPARLPLRPLTGLQLQLSLEERRLQSQDLALTPNTVCTRHLQVTPSDGPIRDGQTQEGRKGQM